MNNIVAWVVLRFSRAPADREHPYGHRKFETLAMFGLASLLVVLAFELALHALRREPTSVASGSAELLVMASLLAVNVVLAVWQRAKERDYNPDILWADSSHTFADVLTTMAVIAGWQLSAHGYVWLDSDCAIAMAALILYFAYGLFRRTVPALVDQSSIDAGKLKAAVVNVQGVLAVTRVRSRWIGAGAAVDMTVAVDAALSTRESHQIADQIEKELDSRFAVRDATIHIEPGD